MRTKRFLASLLVLMMLFSLLPANAVTAFAEDESQASEEAPVEPVREITEEPEATAEPEIAEEPEEEPEAVPADPQADPILYDLWVCGTQVTSQNASNIGGNSAVVFLPESNTLRIGSPSLFTNYSGDDLDAMIYSELPELNIRISLTSSAKNLTISFNKAKTLIDAAKGDLSITTPEGKSLILKSTSATTGIRAAEGSFTLNGQLNMYDDALLYGIQILNGAAYVNGDLNIISGSSQLEACLFANKGVQAEGNVSLDGNTGYNYYGYGIEAPNGPVYVDGELFAATETGILCSGGDVTVTGVAAFMQDTWSEGTACIRTTNGHGVDVNGLQQLGNVNYVILSDGDVTVRGEAAIDNGYPIGAFGIRSVNGKVHCMSDVTMKLRDMFVIAGGEGGIQIDGNATFTCTNYVENPAAVNAENGPVTVNGNLTMSDCGGLYLVLAKGDITVGGDAVLKNNLAQNTVKPYNGAGIKSTEGSIKVDGNFTCSSRESGVYACKDIAIGGNADVKVYSTEKRDYGLYAENGAIAVDVTLTFSGMTANALYAKTDIILKNDATVTNPAEDGLGLASDGTVTFVTGKWDVDAGTAAIQAKEGIQIPAGYGVTLPELGRVAKVGDAFTVTEADKTTVAAHAIIEAVEPMEDGFYLIGPDWTLEAISPENKFDENPNAAGEYMLETSLAIGDEIKVVRVENGAITGWWPDGLDTQYHVDEAHSGDVTIYFKTSYDNAWSEFGGYFYIGAALPPAARVEIFGCSLSLKGNIAINIYVAPTAEVVADPGAYVMLDGVKTLFSEATTRQSQGETLYEFQTAKNAKEMNDAVTLRVYNGNDELVALYRRATGEDLTDTGFSVSIMDYIRITQQTSSNAKLLALVNAMSDYGSLAQVQFDYETDQCAEVMADLSAVTLETLAPYEAQLEEGTATGVAFAGSSLLLKSETILRFYFTVSVGEVSDYSFTIGGTAVTPVKNGNYWYVEVANIAAKDLDETYTITVCSADGTVLTLKASALSYAYTNLKNSTDTKMINLVKGLYLYNKAANEYFA